MLKLSKYSHSSSKETLGKEHDLADVLQIRNDDNHGSEKCLQGLRQFGSTSVAWIHRDEVADATVENRLLTFKLNNSGKLSGGGVEGLNLEDYIPGRL